MGHVDIKITHGDVIRFVYLMNHYRSVMEISATKQKEALKVLRRFLLACEPSVDGPPDEIVEAVADDLNTPKAISIMHKYRKDGEGRKLFAALRFLGFFEDVVIPDNAVFVKAVLLPTTTKENVDGSRNV